MQIISVKSFKLIYRQKILIKGSLGFISFMQLSIRFTRG